MAETRSAFAERLRARFAVVGGTSAPNRSSGEVGAEAPPTGAVVTVDMPRGEVGIVFAPDAWHDGCRALRDEFGFEQLVDVCGVDYFGHGSDEWDTDVSSEGFSRGVEGRGPGRFKFGERPSQQAAQPDAVEITPVPQRRFAAVAQLLSVQHNRRVRVKCFASDDDLPIVDSVTDLWPGANWFERETFDLFGIVFRGHPDLRRILTDYGFIGHPFRKDFPLIGNVEVRYDAEARRVVYEPVTSVEPRVLVPRVIRDDARYATAAGEDRDLKVRNPLGPVGAGDVK